MRQWSITDSSVDISAVGGGAAGQPTAVKAAAGAPGAALHPTRPWKITAPVAEPAQGHNDGEQQRQEEQEQEQAQQEQAQQGQEYAANDENRAPTNAAHGDDDDDDGVAHLQTMKLLHAALDASGQCACGALESGPHRLGRMSGAGDVRTAIDRWMPCG